MRWPWRFRTDDFRHMNVALDESDFAALVAGQIVQKQTPSGVHIRIILSDIGWDRMDKAIWDAGRRAGRPEP